MWRCIKRNESILRVLFMMFNHSILLAIDIREVFLKTGQHQMKEKPERRFCGGEMK